MVLNSPTAAPAIFFAPALSPVDKEQVDLHNLTSRGEIGVQNSI